MPAASASTSFRPYSIASRAASNSSGSSGGRLVSRAATASRACLRCYSANPTTNQQQLNHLASTANHHRPQAAQYHDQRCYGRSWLDIQGRAAIRAKRLFDRTPGADFCTRGLILVGPSGIIPVDQLEECTVFAAALLHLIEQREFVAVKSAEPLIPAKVLQLVITGAAWEIEAQHTA